MPNRILKESICISDSLDGLTWFEEVFFYRLIVNCDDYGRFDGRPMVLKARLFPLKEAITLKDVSRALSSLRKAGVVKMYLCDNKPYLYLPTWEVHQTIRAKRSRYPDPAGCPDTSESICTHMKADVPVIQSNTNPNPNTNPVRRSEEEAPPEGRLFEEFWHEYPKKVGKEAAKRAFAKVPKGAYPRIIPAVTAQRDSPQWKKEGGQYIPNPATWLSQGRWEDEISPIKTKTGERWECAPPAGETESLRALLKSMGGEGKGG